MESCCLGIGEGCEACYLELGAGLAATLASMWDLQEHLTIFKAKVIIDPRLDAVPILVRDL